jgi:broad specificity phosphatase PhoE
LALELRRNEPDLVFSSIEPKAVETGAIIARELGIHLEVVPDLREHAGRGVRDWVSQSEFRARLSEFFGNLSRLVFGNETADDAHHRFARAIDSLVAENPGRSAAVVSHGTVMALFVARANELDQDEVWDRLTSPGYVLMRIPRFEILEKWRFSEQLSS